MSILAKINFFVDPSTASTVQETVDKTLAKLEEIQIADTNKNTDGSFVKFYYGFVYDSRTDVKHYVFPSDTVTQYGLTKNIFRDYEVIPSAEISNLNNQGSTGTSPQVITAAVGEGVLHQPFPMSVWNAVFDPFESDVVVDSVTMDSNTSSVAVTLLCVGKNPKKTVISTSLFGAYDEIFFNVMRNTTTGISTVNIYTSSFTLIESIPLSSVITNPMFVKIYRNYILFISTTAKIMYCYDVATKTLRSLNLPGLVNLNTSNNSLDDLVNNYAEILYISATNEVGIQALYSIDIKTFNNLILIDTASQEVATTLRTFLINDSIYYKKYTTNNQTYSHINVNDSSDVIGVSTNLASTVHSFYKNDVGIVDSVIVRAKSGKTKTVIIGNNYDTTYDLHGFNYTPGVSTPITHPFVFTDKYFYAPDVSWGGTDLNSTGGFKTITRVDRSNSLTYVGTYVSELQSTSWSYNTRTTTNTKILVPAGSILFFNGAKPEVTLKLN